MTALDEFVERHHAAIRCWLSLGPTVIGFYPLTGLINQFWGSLSGFPPSAIARGHPVYGPHPAIEIIAMFGWPLVVLAARVWFAGRLLDWNSGWRTPIILIWALSAFAVVPFYSLPALFLGWPVWCACE